MFASKRGYHVISLTTVLPLNQTRHENKGKNHSLKKLLIVKRILLVSTLALYLEQYGESGC